MHLLNSLNKFINLTASSASIGHGPDNGLSMSQLKVVTNFLRLNLLSPLRRLEPVISISAHVKQSSRPSSDVLTQWWLTLLNFINSTLISETTNTSLAMDAISVSLECVSRIISLTSLAVDSSVREREIYSYHLLLTVRWVTNRLVLNSRKRSDLLDTKLANAQATAVSNTAPVVLQFLQRYTELLTPLIGKVIAFAFCYLSDELHYDFEVIKFISRGRFDIKDIGDTVLLPDRSKQFCALDHAASQSEYTVGLVEEFNTTKLADPMPQETKKVFPIMISYLQNPQVVTTFLFHYWSIVLITHHQLGLQSLDVENFPGFSLISQFCSTSLKADLERLSRFIKAQDKQEKHESSLLKATETSNPSQINVSREKIINFIFTKFHAIRLIESTRSVVGFFHTTSIDKKLLSSFFSYQERSFLKICSVISAYESWMANIIFNILLQFFIFHFDTLPELIEVMSWHEWIEGIFGTLKTFNADSQLVGLICLFNVWNTIPINHRNDVIDALVDGLWDLLSVDTDFHIINILFHKLIVFKILTDQNLNEDRRQTIKRKLNSINEEVLRLINASKCDYAKLVDEKTVLYFHTNNALMLERQEPLFEDDLLLINQYKHSEANNRNINNTSLFTNISRMNNIRPAVVICRGKNPFDVSDELVTRAALLIAQKNKTKRESGAIRDTGSSSASSVHSNNTLENGNFKQYNELKFGLGALLSGFSEEKPEPPTKQSPANNKRRDSVVSGSTTDTFEAQEMISMYSTVSSVASNSSKSESSEDLLYKLSQKSRSHVVSTSDNDTTKKRKLMAPPESKFTKDIVSKEPIRYLFKTVTINSQVTQKKNMIDKIQDYNKKWGVQSANPYDKPLPNPFSLSSDTLLDGFDFDSLAPTIEELQQLNLVEDCVAKVYDNETSNEDDHTIPQIDLSQFFNGGSFVESNELHEKREYSQNNEPATNVGRMKLITRLAKLIKVTHTFNLTSKEFFEFRKVNGDNLIYMELDPGFYQNHSLNKGLLAISSYK
ncbi:unnamed protein product [Kluyveromyces dobzhanskii CBS 2104]|uniref:WGS project CCBQ000000000 data, contig 00016 n=1 Tax=Kluyveromyces dobzhanskii CBS 2104 TaxID=1427455 RepID=A0A0A8L1N2_9SACH|nr:unnamed protein product [Kluyveromyces dobzhanskii CBS 2104]